MSTVLDSVLHYFIFSKNFSFKKNPFFTGLRGSNKKQILFHFLIVKLQIRGKVNVIRFLIIIFQSNSTPIK